MGLGHGPAAAAGGEPCFGQETAPEGTQQSTGVFQPLTTAGRLTEPRVPGEPWPLWNHSLAREVKEVASARPLDQQQTAVRVRSRGGRDSSSRREHVCWAGRDGESR